MKLKTLVFKNNMKNQSEIDYIEKFIVSVLKRGTIKKNLGHLQKLFDDNFIEAQISHMKGVQMYTLKYGGKQIIIDNAEELLNFLNKTE